VILRKISEEAVGRTDMEDALHRLDKLTLEEARMATAEVLKATHAVDERVRGVDDERDRVAGIGDRVADVDDRVRAVDEKVAVVIDGAQSFPSQSPKIYSTVIRLDGNEARVVMQQTANDVDQVKRT
jgi:hypothetical protein